MPDSSPPPVPSPTTTPEPYRCTRCWWNGMARSLADAQQQHWHANVACTKAASYSSVELVAPSAPFVDGARPSAPPSDPTPPEQAFGYLLNAMERAAQEDKPAEHGYAEKRAAVLAFVRGLAESAATLASQRAARARAETEVRLTGCCTRCGAPVAIEWGRVNDTVCHHVAASCTCHASLNLWPAGQPEAVSRDV